VTRSPTVGDRVGNASENAGDDLHEPVDDASLEASYQRGRTDEASDS
jgi:hypothetical protein